MGRSLRYLDPSEITATQAAGAAHLRIQIKDDQSILSARVKRAFPLSEPNRLISIHDGADKEVGILRTIDGLESATKRLIEDQLDRRYFTPRISEIRSLIAEAGMWRFRVMTQRGTSEFFVRNWRDSATEISAGRWQIYSVDGGRFEIVDLEALDATSRKFMDLLL